MLTKSDIVSGLKKLGVSENMELEVHSSLSSFGFVDEGAIQVIAALKQVVGENGSLFMPALRLSTDLPLTDLDRQLGIIRKIKILSPDIDKSAMGVISDTFRKMPDVVTGDGVFGISGWGRNANEAKNGLNYLLSNGGRALLLGVDIYKLTAMHYVEEYLPEKIPNMFKPTDEINKLYPPEEWMIETGEPAVKAWYKIQDMAFEKGLIKTELIGNSKCMLFDIWDIVG